MQILKGKKSSWCVPKIINGMAFNMRTLEGEKLFPCAQPILREIDRRSNFPTKITEDLNQLISNFARDGFPESMWSWSELIGEVDWNVDETNAHLMWKALR